MYQWIRSYLYNRRARVNVDQTKSKKFLLRHGVLRAESSPPHSSFSSSTIWCLRCPRGSELLSTQTTL
ncbi:hypothetical protein V1264_003677 [Littorina saxatilis]|uniref:Uncharacterized protein n=1 Tax=Littorina saxatilis TaxID=31220 RepID=A0AAN9B7X5_9CAEN